MLALDGSARERRCSTRTSFIVHRTWPDDLGDDGWNTVLILTQMQQDIGESQLSREWICRWPALPVSYLLHVDIQSEKIDRSTDRQAGRHTVKKKESEKNVRKHKQDETTNVFCLLSLYRSSSNADDEAMMMMMDIPGCKRIVGGWYSTFTVNERNDWYTRSSTDASSRLFSSDIDAARTGEIKRVRCRG